MMIFPAIALAVALGQGAAPTAPTTDLSVISARLDDCAADFVVKDANGEPVYAAIVHVRIRYGFLSIKRMDLEVGTNSEGKARVEGLPRKARPLTYDISKADKTTTVRQDLSTTCHANFEVALPR